MEAGEKENVPAWVLFLPNEEQDYVMGLVARVGTLTQELDDLAEQVRLRDMNALDGSEVSRVIDQRDAAEAALAEAKADKEKLHTWGEEWKVKARAAEAALAEQAGLGLQHPVERRNAEAALADNMRRALDDDDAILHGYNAIRRMLIMRVGSKHDHAEAFRRALAAAGPAPEEGA